MKQIRNKVSNKLVDNECAKPYIQIIKSGMLKQIRVGPVSSEQHATQTGVRKMSKHRVIWPQERYMSDDDIRAYYADAVADKQVLPGMVNIEDMKYVLSDAGLFTFGSN